MPRLSRVLAPLSVAIGVCALAPASALAGPTATFPDTTVNIVDPGPASSTVHLTVTANSPADLAKTKVFLGRGTYVYDVIGTDGVHQVDDDFEDLDPSDCAVFPSASRPEVPVAVVGSTLTADLPKGEVIAFEDVDVAAVVTGPATGCTRGGVAGVALDFFAEQQTIDGFAWNAPAKPALTAKGGRREVTLTFAQEAGTSYELWRVVDGVRESVPFRENLRGVAGATSVVIDSDDDGNELPPGTNYDFQVRAIRQFGVWQGMDMVQPASPFSSMVNVSTKPIQSVYFSATPSTVTSARTATFRWFVLSSDPGDIPTCFLDGVTPVTCTATGVTLTGLSLGAHTLSVYPADGERVYEGTWTVVEAPAPPPLPPTVPTVDPTPANPADLDGDGIETTWLVGGKPAPAPKTPKASVSGGRVKLTLAAAPKGAKSIRVYRADGKGAYKLVKTLKAKSKAFTDTNVKPGQTYKYKTVAVNAKGQQGTASGAVSAKLKKQ